MKTGEKRLASWAIDAVFYQPNFDNSYVTNHLKVEGSWTFFEKGGKCIGKNSNSEGKLQTSLFYCEKENALETDHRVKVKV